MFLIRPTPLPGESLSSWRQRAGAANGFRLFPRPDGFRSWGEPDRLPVPEEVRWLKDEYLLSEEKIEAISLEAVGSNIASEFGKTAKLRWVIPSANRKPGSPGGSCCPLCLAEDDVPYFRLAWRFAFLTHCPSHGCLLIDRCPSCSNLLWPVNIRHIVGNRPHDFSICESCGERLDVHVCETPLLQSSSRALWECASKANIPLELQQAANPREVFSGLWSICQLLLRKNARRIWIHLPFENTKLYAQLESVPDAIELLPMEFRQDVLAAAYWLLAEWPNRFIDIAKAANLSRQHFAPSWRHHPHWLNEITEKSLSLRKFGVTVEQVQGTIDSLKVSGNVISKSAVRRALGVSEARAIDAALSQRRTGKASELMTLCRKFEKKLVTITSSRDQKATLVRDYLILLLSILAGRKVEEICQMPNSAIRALLSAKTSDNHADSTSYLLISGRAKQLNEMYEVCYRPKMVGINRSECHWFVGRNGDNLAGHTVRERVAKMMRVGFPSDLWNSTDVFLKLLR
jgi:hypothetical protein